MNGEKEESEKRQKLDPIGKCKQFEAQGKIYGLANMGMMREAEKGSWQCYCAHCSQWKNLSEKKLSNFEKHVETCCPWLFPQKHLQELLKNLRKEGIEPVESVGKVEKLKPVVFGERTKEKSKVLLDKLLQVGLSGGLPLSFVEAPWWKLVWKFWGEKDVPLPCRAKYTKGLDEMYNSIMKVYVQ